MFTPFLFEHIHIDYFFAVSPFRVPFRSMLFIISPDNQLGQLYPRLYFFFSEIETKNRLHEKNKQRGDP